MITSGIKKISDYSEYFNIYGIHYRETEFYYFVGESNRNQGWIIHISVIPAQIGQLVERIFPLLISERVAFKIIRNKDHHYSLDRGLYGNSQVGKAITLYPESDDQAVGLVEALRPMLKDIKGPVIFSDFCLGDNLYCRYGSFKTMIVTDRIGRKERLIYNGNQELERDVYTTPSRIPEGITNPFQSILDKMPVTKQKRILNDKYLFGKIIHKSAHGFLYKTLSFSGLFFKHLVIKQGLHNMLSDDYGRDITDRLQWQYLLQKKLEKSGYVPKVYNQFEEDGNYFLVMDFIKGKILAAEVVSLFSNNSWSHLSKGIKTKILDYVLQIIEILKGLHKVGLVHRDITGTNFMVTKSDKIFLIDLELVYDIHAEQPYPPFQFGTSGYMSPEQYTKEKPTTESDVYSLGALMILLFTGLEPIYFIEKDLERIFKKLRFLIQEEEIVKLIMDCIEIRPTARPTLDSIAIFIRSKKIKLNPSISIQNYSSIYTENGASDIIQNAINGLASPQMHHKKLWLSESYNGFNAELNALGNRDIYIGMNRGVSGVIYLLEKARLQGFCIHDLEDLISNGANYIVDYTQKNMAQMGPGLHFGTASSALLLACSSLSRKGLSNETVDNLLLNCLDKPNSALNLINGKAGQGIAALRCLEYSKNPRLEEVLDNYVREILLQQERDGSWSEPFKGGKSKEKFTSFGYGMAGIVYFLFEYLSRRHDPSVENAATNGIEYLLRKSKKDGRSIYWQTSNLSRTKGLWWCNGTPGIILSFLKAYQITKDKRYKEVVESALHFHPKECINKNLSQCHGISGLGEIYLEAHHVIHSKEAYDRAKWIFDLLIQLRKSTKSGSFYWLVESHESPTADLMAGNAGVIHFLMRFHHPGQLKYPLL